jgi:threonine dehydrogenase-like Zn-dependent dehydrogenase
MKALTVRPKRSGSAEVLNVPEPGPELGSVLVETIAVGVCGTDREIIKGEYGTAPPGQAYLIIGHESIGRVIEAPKGGGIAPGDLVVGMSIVAKA